MFLKIRKFNHQDARQVSQLIIEVFNDQPGSSFSPAARKFFVDGNSPEKILLLNTVGEIYVAESGKKIIGVIAGRNNGLVTRLFVYKKFQGQGIARKLMQRIESLYKKRGAKTMHVRSSLFAINFYKSIGYKKATRIIYKKDGMVYQPMIKRFE